MTEHRSQKKLPEGYALRLDLLNFYDELVEYQDTCAFFCDAVTTMLVSRNEFDQATLEGLTDFATLVKETGNALKEKFRRIQERIATESPPGQDS